MPKHRDSLLNAKKRKYKTFNKIELKKRYFEKKKKLKENQIYLLKTKRGRVLQKHKDQDTIQIQ